MLFTHYFLLVSDYPAVILHAERVLAHSQSTRDSNTLLKTYQVWPFAHLRLGRPDEAMRIAREGRQLAQEYGDRVKEGYILITMGLIAIEQKEPTTAHAYFLDALAIAQEAGDRRLESRALGNLGYSAGFVLQDYAQAREYYEKALGLSRQFGDRSLESTTLGNLGWVAGMLGDFDAAFSYYARGLPLSREVGNLYNETYQLINLSANSGVRNDPQASLEYSVKALELARQTGDRSAEAWSFLYMGYAYLLDEDFARAEECFHQSMLIREELEQPSLRTEPQAGLIQAFLLNGEPAAALAEVEEVLAYLGTVSAPLEGTEEPLRVYYACYRALALAPDPRAVDVLASAAQLLEQQVLKLRDQTSRRMFVENVPWRLAIQQEWQRLRS
jgi:tetratricopeptide (TPR) repeat protein